MHGSCVPIYFEGPIRGSITELVDVLLVGLAFGSEIEFCFNGDILLHHVCGDPVNCDIMNFRKSLKYSSLSRLKCSKKMTLDPLFSYEGCHVKVEVIGFLDRKRSPSHHRHKILKIVPRFSVGRMIWMRSLMQIYFIHFNIVSSAKCLTH